MTQSNIDNTISVDILDYLGKHEDGILALLSLGYQDKYYEATFYYTKEMVALTPDDKLEEKLLCQIEDWQGYNNLILNILKRVVPYEEMINMVDNFNPEKYGLYLTQSSGNL